MPPRGALSGLLTISVITPSAVERLRGQGERLTGVQAGKLLLHLSTPFDGSVVRRHTSGGSRALITHDARLPSAGIRLVVFFFSFDEPVISNLRLSLIKEILWYDARVRVCGWGNSISLIGLRVILRNAVSTNFTEPWREPRANESNNFNPDVLPPHSRRFQIEIQVISCNSPRGGRGRRASFKAPLMVTDEVEELDLISFHVWHVTRAEKKMKDFCLVFLFFFFFLWLEKIQGK